MGFSYRIVVEWSEADDVFVARVPSLPGCAAHGDSEADAVAEARIAADAIVAAMRASGRPIPPPDLAQLSGKIQLRLPRSLHAALAARATVEGVSLNQMMVVLLAGATPTGERAALEERARPPYRKAAVAKGKLRRPARASTR